MIEIHNNIGQDIKAEFYYKGETIGCCTNALAFFDALCQIKQENNPHYTITVKTTLPNGDERTQLLKVTPDGRISPASNRHFVLWNDILCSQLLYLDGFKNDFFYKKITK